jgi:hypothetical protein
MVKLARPKANITDRIRAKNALINSRGRKPGLQARVVPKEQPSSSDDTSLGSDGYPKNKGMYAGSCNRSACLKPSAIWFNHSTRKYYCASCAHELNYDRFNKADSLRMYGHLLCTEGRYDPEWNYEYNVCQKDIVKFPEEPKISDVGSLTIRRPTIEQKYFDNFMSIFENGERYQNCNLGRAFYNHFGLYKLNDQSFFRDLFLQEGDEAKARLKEIFEFN